MGLSDCSSHVAGSLAKLGSVDIGLDIRFNPGGCELRFHIRTMPQLEVRDGYGISLVSVGLCEGIGLGGLECKNPTVFGNELFTEPFQDFNGSAFSHLGA